MVSTRERTFRRAVLKVLEAHPEGAGFNELYRMIPDAPARGTFGKRLKDMLEERLVTKAIGGRRGQKTHYRSTREGVRYFLDMGFLEDIAAETDRVIEAFYVADRQRGRAKLSPNDLLLYRYYSKRVAELPTLILQRSHQVALTYEQGAGKSLMEFAWELYRAIFLKWGIKLEAIRRKLALAPPEPRDELEGFPKEGGFLSHLPSFSSYGIKCKDTDTPTVTSLMVCDLQGLGYVLGDIDPSLSEHDLSPSELQTYRKRRDESNYVLASLIPLTVRWNRLFSDKALDQFKEGATVDLSSPYSASRDILDRLEELRREIHKTKSTIQERCEVRAGGSKEE